MTTNVTISKPIFILILLGSLAAYFFIAYQIFKKPEPVYQQLMTQDKKSMEQFVQAEIVRAKQLEEEQRIKDVIDQYSMVELDQDNEKAIYGNSKAKFTLVVYTDMECPYCKRFHSTVKNFIKSSEGLVNWEYMHFPLDFHNPAAQIEAVASECIKDVSGTRAYWAFIDRIFSSTRGNGAGVEDIRAIAKQVGSDNKDFLTCVSEAHPAKTMESHYQMGSKMGVNSTPYTVIVNNTTGDYSAVRGALDERALFDAIKQLDQK